MKNKDIFINKVGAKNTMGNEQECRENGMKTWPGEKEHSVWTVLFLLLKKTGRKRQRKLKKVENTEEKEKKRVFGVQLLVFCRFPPAPISVSLLTFAVVKGPFA